MAAVLGIDIEEQGRTLFLRLRGELDIAAAPRLEQALSSERVASAEEVVLDLRGVEFMDSSGLRAVLRAAARGSDDGYRLSLIRGPAEVDRIFRLTGADAQLDFVEDDGRDTRAEG